LEFDNKVKSYQEQPQIDLPLSGRKKVYSADCYVEYFDIENIKNCIIEVKYTNELKKKQEYFEKKFNIIRKAAKNLDLDFKIFTEEDFTETYIFNLDFLYRYKTQPRDVTYDEDILNRIDEHIMSATELVNNITKDYKESLVVANAIWGLVADGILKADLARSEITMNTKVGKNL